MWKEMCCTEENLVDNIKYFYTFLVLTLNKNKTEKITIRPTLNRLQNTRQNFMVHTTLNVFLENYWWETISDKIGYWR